MNEFSVRGTIYQASRMPALDALDVARKWADPLLTAATSAKADFNGADFTHTFVIFGGGVNKESVNSVMLMCLGYARQKMGGDTGWAPVAQNGVLMFQDKPFDELLEIVFGVLVANRLAGPGSFFVERLAASKAPTTG